MVRTDKEATDALAALQNDPNDPNANLIAGRYVCFVNGDWSVGLPMLALGDDEALRQLAAKELTEPKISDEQVALAVRRFCRLLDQAGSCCSRTQT